MKIAYYLAFLAVSIGGSGCGWAKEPSLNGVVRTMSMLIELDTICSKYVPVDRQAARKMFAASVQVGRENWPEKVFDEAVDAEYDRRREEVAITGEEHWCRYQEGYLKYTGSNFLFHR